MADSILELSQGGLTGVSEDWFDDFQILPGPAGGSLIRTLPDANGILTVVTWTQQAPLTEQGTVNCLPKEGERLPGGQTSNSISYFGRSLPFVEVSRPTRTIT